MAGFDMVPESAGEPPRKASLVGRAVRKGAPLVVAGALGAGLAVGIGAAVVDTDGGTTTIVREAASTTAAPQTSGSASRFASEGRNLSIQEIYKKVGPGVVQITATSQGADSALNPFGQGGQQALGSGFVIDKAGHIVTNYHVVEGADEVDVSFSNGDRVRATIVGTDPSSDVAVLQVDMPASALTPIELGDSDRVRVGDPVVAIGNPFGLDRTVTAGIVSAVQRHIQAPNGFPIDHVIQTDAAINHGNSGGPLLDSQGRVIGVNSQIQGGSVDGNVGVGFAVPINTVKEVAAQLIENGKVERAFLGIEMQTITPEAASALHLPVDKGVLIATVRPGSPAARAGLKGGGSSTVVDGESWVLGGDIIVEADGQAIENDDQLREIVLAKKPGDSLELKINRNGQTMTITAKLGRQPTTPTG
jgi:S1-C subfamily serine protease